ncbi:hypothetical protein AMK15_11150 [Streptomyces sp. MJM1172]|nr:hypothetical protein AMK15_11150 [Streptomyces sp. MJM1172]
MRHGQLHLLTDTHRPEEPQPCVGWGSSLLWTSLVGFGMPKSLRFCDLRHTGRTLPPRSGAALKSTTLEQV